MFKSTKKNISMYPIQSYEINNLEWIFIAKIDR